MKKHLVIYIFFFNFPFADIAYGQFAYGTTGLLHMPTADMHRDKTVMVGTSYLDIAAMPGRMELQHLELLLELDFFSLVGSRLCMYAVENGSVRIAVAQQVPQSRQAFCR